MATITVRDLDEDVRRLLKERAAGNNRSMEAEARAILTDAVRTRTLVEDLLLIGDELREMFGGVELELPERAPWPDRDPFS